MQTIHPVAVHFAVGLIIVSFIMELMYFLRNVEVWREVAKWNLAFGSAAVLAAVVSGMIAESIVQVEQAANEVMEQHKNIGFITLGFVGILVLWRFTQNGEYYEKMPGIYLLIFGLGVIFLIVGSYFGGQLVYSFGVGVEAAR